RDQQADRRTRRVPAQLGRKPRARLGRPPRKLEPKHQRLYPWPTLRRQYVLGRCRAGAAALVMLTACARRAPTPVLAPLEAPGPGVTVTLRWTASVDLDLYVTDPDLETAYFANPRTRSGGVLARDARCADGPPGARTEQVHWTTPPRGRYRVGVDFPEVCG